VLRVAGGEMARELHDLRLLMGRGCLDVVQPDATIIGGLSGLARIARLAQGRGLTSTPHNLGDGLGLMANAQLAGGWAAAPGSSSLTIRPAGARSAAISC